LFPDVAIGDLADSRIRIAEASTLMGLGRRQVFRMANAYDEHVRRCWVTTARKAAGSRLNGRFFNHFDISQGI
jgi:hypothetical protein